MGVFLPIMAASGAASAVGSFFKGKKKKRNRARLQEALAGLEDPRKVGARRAQGSLDALTAREQYLTPFTERKTLAPWAQRGFGLSGTAELDVRKAVGDLRAKFESRRQATLNDAISVASQERAAEENRLFRLTELS
jgi:hypothetical protein